MIKSMFKRLKRLSEERCSGRQKHSESGLPRRCHVEMKWTLAMNTTGREFCNLVCRFHSSQETGEEMKKFRSTLHIQASG